jgi:hypothetical protein
VASKPGLYHQVQFGVFLRASYQLNWKCTDKQTGSVPSSSSVSGLESIPGSVLQNLFGGVLGSVLRVYLEMF